ncbi:type I restriction endonuclease [Thermodesulfobium sp. 4217-1]|uniref:Restriction endonuclease type I HsdR N-terminal domain-containing protein n=1 Tax=Thermodesulfobium acidiphilum TaxID=1794699 RepID=A0A2R4W0R2_THEAF|nr:type I restriction endonuclease [Thermodesulfobium acidiphilum]AWB10268.1 hypothetical protein TDSAC_0911 [Thermodesulfobium acidiphilum]
MPDAISEQEINKKLLDFIRELKKDGRQRLLNEEATKQSVILPILNALKWNVFDIESVFPEYSVNDKRVDYSLRSNKKNKVFIEVKKINEDLDQHQEQLLNYSFQEGVGLSVLTNGISWWFYLPSGEGSWAQRKFYTIEIYEQEDKVVVEKFEKLLSKDNVVSGKSLEYAKEIYYNKEKQNLINTTLPKAWNKIITDPDELLIELLADETEKLCGYKPDSETVEQFLTRISQEEIKTENIYVPTKIKSMHKKSDSSVSNQYSGKKPISFSFKGVKYSLRSWKELIVKLCEIILSKHKDQFNYVLDLHGTKRPYFSSKLDELRKPERISGTDIYLETNLSANSIVKLSKDIITLFGYKDSDLKIEIQ